MRVDTKGKSSVGGLSAQSAPFVSTDGLKVYGGTYAKIFCIDAKAGTMLWSVTQSTIGTMGDGKLTSIAVTVSLCVAHLLRSRFLRAMNCCMYPYPYVCVRAHVADKLFFFKKNLDGV